MQYIDGIQPPLGLYGSLHVEAGKAYYCEEGKSNILYAPEAWIMERYLNRLQHEEHKANNAENTATEQAENIEDTEKHDSGTAGTGTSGLLDEGDELDDLTLDELNKNETLYDTETYPVGTHISFKTKLAQAFTGKK